MEVANEQWNNLNKENICGGNPVEEVQKVSDCEEGGVKVGDDHKSNGLVCDECLELDKSEQIETEIVIKDLIFDKEEVVELESGTEKIIEDIGKDKDTRVSESVKETLKLRLDEKDHENDSGTDLGPDDHNFDESECLRGGVVRDASVERVNSDVSDTGSPDTSGVCISDQSEDCTSSVGENTSEEGAVMGNTVEGENMNEHDTNGVRNADECKDDRFDEGETEIDSATNNNIECDKGKHNFESEDKAIELQITEDIRERDTTCIYNNTSECLEITGKCEHSLNDCLQISQTNDESLDINMENEAKKDLSHETSLSEGAKSVEDAEIVIDREKVQQFIDGVLNDIQNMVNDGDIDLDIYKDKHNGEIDLDIEKDVNDGEIDVDIHKDVHGTSNVEKVNIDQMATNTNSEEKDKTHANKRNEKEAKNKEAETIEPQTMKETLSEQCNDNAGKSSEDSIDKTNQGDQNCDIPLDQSLEIQKTPSVAAKALVGVGLQNSIMVEEEMVVARQALHKAQELLQNERAKHNRQLMEVKLKLYHSQISLKQQRVKSESQMSDVMSRLMLLEGRLRKEQAKVKEKLSTKDKEISNLEVQVKKHREQNEQLLNLMNEICAQGGMNGYMRDGKKKNGEKGDLKDKKGKDAGKLGSKFSAKNRSSLELSSFKLEDLLNSGRLCSSQEDLRGLGGERKRSDPKVIPVKNGRSPKENISPKDNFSPKGNVSAVDHGRITSISSKSASNCLQKPSQVFFGDSEQAIQQSMNRSTSDSSQSGEVTNSSGVYSNSDQDNYDHESYYDDDDEHIFSFNSTHISTPIAEEEGQASPKIHVRGHMMSMGSMPDMAYRDRDQRLQSGKNRPHSLSSVDLDMIERHEQRLAQQQQPEGLYNETHATPPSSPSYNQPKNTPFQTFKTMFKRKGSKNKGKKRSVSLSQTTDTEHREALKKVFEKYDMQ